MCWFKLRSTSASFTHSIPIGSWNCFEVLAKASASPVAETLHRVTRASSFACNSALSGCAGHIAGAKSITTKRKTGRMGISLSVHQDLVALIRDAFYVLSKGGAGYGPGLISNCLAAVVQVPDGLQARAQSVRILGIGCQRPQTYRMGPRCQSTNPCCRRTSRCSPANSTETMRNLERNEGSLCAANPFFAVV